MPCQGGCHASPQSYKEELDKVTDLLCQLCKKLEDAKVMDTFFSSELRVWWENHKLLDAKRKEEERLREEREILRLEENIDKMKKEVERRLKKLKKG